jgi:hypothetical protein
MREALVGYLLDALDADERAKLEHRLRQDPQLQHELELLYESLEPLRADEGNHAPPPGLAARTCALVARHSLDEREGTSSAIGAALDPFHARFSANSHPMKTLAPAKAGSSRSDWSLADMAVAAGIFLAATTLLFPALQQSRNSARIAGCQNNLRQLGTSLAEYSHFNCNYFPSIPSAGKLAAAGLYAVQLAEKQLLPEEQLLICPNTQLAAQPENCDAFHVPRRKELEGASGTQLACLQKKMGGSYGYTLGYMQDGEYRSVRNQGRTNFAIMADAPSLNTEGRRSLNHGGCGQNVLYEDGHVKYVTNCMQEENADHLYLNDDGLMAAGVHEQDSTIGSSQSSPLLRVLAGQE